MCQSCLSLPGGRLKLYPMWAGANPAIAEFSAVQH
jgi:hypothetical protein